MSLKLNLEKSVQSLKLSLEKAGMVTPPVVEVGFGLDVSGSFDDEHRQGVTDSLLTRLVPWGLTFDPDKKLDVFTFSDGPSHVHEVGAVHARNYFGFVQDRIINKVPGYGRGTDYSYLLERMLTHFGWGEDAVVVKKAGFLGRLMGKQDTTVPAAKKRSLVIMVTDGDNYDTDRTKAVLRASEKRQDEVYFLFLGVSNQSSAFPFLKTIGDEFKNTGFVGIKDLQLFIGQSDEELNAQLLDDELLAWLKG